MPIFRLLKTAHGPQPTCKPDGPFRRRGRHSLFRSLSIVLVYFVCPRLIAEAAGTNSFEFKDRERVNVWLSRVRNDDALSRPKHYLPEPGMERRHAGGDFTAWV